MKLFSLLNSTHPLIRWGFRIFLINVLLFSLLFLVLFVAIYAVPYPVEAISPEVSGPLVITDRDGRVLRRVSSVEGRPGRETWVPLERIPSHAILTLIASEDSEFFEHVGVSPKGFLRAAWLNMKEGRIGYGGSTLTMQLMRMVHSPGEARTWFRKLEESILALRIERSVDKHFILEQYLNRAYYGNGAYGIEAAAQLYFGKSAESLSISEACLLAILPRSPSRYNPLQNLDKALERRSHVFSLLQKGGLLSKEEIQRAQAQPLSMSYHAADFLAPHFTEWVLSSIPQHIRKKGGTLKTTLDLSLQTQLEHRLKEHVKQYQYLDLRQAGMLVLDTQSGEVLAMIGSPDFSGPDGEINIVTRRRHPGSALKPFVYALALEEGDSPASIAYDILDVPSLYKIDQLTQPEHGPVRYREALAGSYNLAAVHVLEKIGIDRLVGALNRAGIQIPGTPKDYGLRLALGSAKVRLLDLASAYGFLVRNGWVTPATHTIHLEKSDQTLWKPVPNKEQQLFSPEVSWLTMDMLADAEARRPAFGMELPIDLPFQVAFKTGTSRGFSDTVAIGVTEEYTVAAWAGNFDGAPTQGLVAMKAAAPLVRAGLLLAGEGRSLHLPPMPSQIIQMEVCPLSGQLPSAVCPHRKREFFTASTAPKVSCSWHRVENGQSRVYYPPEVRAWARRVGLIRDSFPVHQSLDTPGAL